MTYATSSNTTENTSRWSSRHSIYNMKLYVAYEPNPFCGHITCEYSSFEEMISSILHFGIDTVVDVIKDVFNDFGKIVSHKHILDEVKIDITEWELEFDE